MTSAIDPAASPSTSQPFPVDIPFLHDLGVEFLGMGNGEAQVALNLLPRHMNSWHVTHGGITMTLLDVAMSMAGRSLNPAAKAGVTVDMTTSFLQPGGRPGARIVAKGRAFHRSTTLCFCEGEVWNGEQLVARAMGTFKYVGRLDVDKKLSPQPGAD
ncbi:PaaI family thioesterase [Undibacterium arcticum]|uniref:PaaI family thioesterase n=1 Tax=Undibacterium arcticum TaxID=1762892 RepID=A0ABV7EYK3_9BURK